MNGSSIRQRHKRALKEARRESNGEKKRPGWSRPQTAIAGTGHQPSERYKRAAGKAGRGK